MPQLPAAEAFWDEIGESLQPSALAVRFYEMWNGMRPAPLILPGRQHIRMEAMAGLLPNISMFDIEIANQKLRLRRRLVGTGLVDAMGRDPTGEYLDDDSHHDPQSRSTMTARAAKVIARKVPHWRLGPPLLKVYWQGGVPFVETVLAPLATDGQTPDIILSFALFLNESRQQTQPFKW